MKSTGGFTLIEMIVVVALIALIAVFAIPTIASYFRVSMNSAVRDIATKVKDTYNSTMVSGRVHRLVYDLKSNSYWVETGPPTLLLDTSETREKEERRKKFAKPNEAPPPSVFSLDRILTRTKISLPAGVAFEDIVTEQSPDPITEGTTYTHFFPHGMTEQTIIHLKDRSDHHTSLVISPVVGRTDLYENYVEKSHVFGK